MRNFLRGGAMKSEQDIYKQFTSGEIKIELDDKTAERIYEELNINQGQETYEFIKNALEKQIPKKPIFRYEKIGRENVCVSCCCPNPKCNNTSLGNNEYMFDYCEECGQRLDWS